MRRAIHLAAILLAVLTAPGFARAGAPVRQPTVRELIHKLYLIEGPGMRTDEQQEKLGREIYFLVKRIGPKAIRDDDIRALIGHLQAWNDKVSGMMADALGSLGPRARVAVPALRKVEEDFECQTMFKGKSLVEVEAALKDIGEENPYPNCVMDPISGKLVMEGYTDHDTINPAP